MGDLGYWCKRRRSGLPQVAVVAAGRSVLCVGMLAAMSSPRDAGRGFRVLPEQAGQTLAALVRAHLGMSWKRAKQCVSTGKVFVDGTARTDVAWRPNPGQVLEVRMSAPRPQSPSATVRIVHEDGHVVVIDKPAGVSSVPYEARETGTAMDLLRAAWRRKYPDAGRVPLHVVHRIDKATSGLLMFAKSKRAERELGGQLRAHVVEREYVCAVHGRARSGRIESRLIRDRGDGLRGSNRRGQHGKRAVTHVEVIDCLPAAGERPSVTLCRVRLETGKTHQIRIHLSERGHPLVGERVYIRDFLAAERPVISAPRLLLHARTLGFAHPITGKEIACSAPLPEDFTAVLSELGWTG